MLELGDAADRAISTYSGGMKRRLDVGLGIVHRPRVLFLDEPTTGLDPQARARMWDEVRRLREQGTTVFLTTHYLDEADALADRLAIIDHGTIVASGTSDELKRQVAGDVVRLGVDGSRDRVIGLVSGLPFVREAAAEDDLVRLYVDRGEVAVPQLLRVLDGEGLTAAVDLAPPAQPRRRLPAPDRSLAPRRAGRLSIRTQPPSTAPHPRSLPMQTLRETWLIFRRSLVLTLRQPVWLLMGIFQPILYLVLFGPLLEGAVTQAGAGVNAFDWFVPGMLVMVAVFGAAFVGFGLIAELRYGVIERMRVTPMSRIAMLLGRSLRDATLLLMQAVIMIVIAIPFGITLDPAGLVVTLALVGPHRPGDGAAVVLGRARAEERGRLRAGRPVRRPAAAPAVGHLPAAPARAGLAPDAGGPEPGHVRRRRRARRLQRVVGRPGDRRRVDDRHRHRDRRGVHRVARVQPRDLVDASAHRACTAPPRATAPAAR